MAAHGETNCERLREAFEGRHAVYVEKGVICVQVTNIRYSVTSRHIGADIEEVSTPQVTGGLFHGHQGSLRRWRIGGGYLTTFSEDTWHAGYGGWSLFFAPDIVRGLAELATDWPTELDAYERYRRALQFFEEHGEVCPAGWKKGKAGMDASTEGVAKYLAENADQL